jgi:hypothetical protein
MTEAGTGDGAVTGDGAGTGDAGTAGTAETTWRDGLPTDLKTIPSLEKFKDETEMVPMPINLARSYINAEQLIGRDKIPIPKTPEEWDNTYARLGKPKDKELYVLPVAEGTDPQLAEVLVKESSWFRDKAFELGLSEKQATEIFSAFSENAMNSIGNNIAASEAEKLNSEIQLRTEFGPAYEGKMVLAGRAARELGGEEFVNLMDTTGVGNHPAFIRFNMKVGAMMAEDLGLDKNTGELLQSTESIKDQILTIQQAPEYTDATNPAHMGAVGKVAALMEQLHGGK